MLIDTVDLFKNEGYQVNIDGELDFSEVDYYGSHPFRKAVVVGKAQNKGGIVSMKVEVDLAIETECARCLAPLSRHKKFKVRETLVRESEETDSQSETYTVVSGRNLDLDEVVLRAILLDIDMVFLCREDCKGLCPICGADLNEGMCDCGKES